MSAIKPDILAKVRMYGKDEKGREGATPPDRFGCPLSIDGIFFECRLLLDGIGSLAPGQTATVPIVFLNPQLIRSHLVKSKTFQLWEDKAIADGEILEIFLEDKA